MRYFALVAMASFAFTATTAEAKRFRLLPGTKPVQATAPVAAPAAKPATVASSGRGVPIVVFSSGGSASAATSNAETQRQALRNTAWMSNPAGDAPSPVKPVKVSNPDARELPVLGLGGGDLRPVKGFQSLN